MSTSHKSFTPHPSPPHALPPTCLHASRPGSTSIDIEWTSNTSTNRETKERVALSIFRWRISSSITNLCLSLDIPCKKPCLVEPWFTRYGRAGLVSAAGVDNLTIACDVRWECCNETSVDQPQWHTWLHDVELSVNYMQLRAWSVPDCVKCLTEIPQLKSQLPKFLNMGEDLYDIVYQKDFAHLCSLSTLILK